MGQLMEILPVVVQDDLMSDIRWLGTALITSSIILAVGGLLCTWLLVRSRDRQRD